MAPKMKGIHSSNEYSDGLYLRKEAFNDFKKRDYGIRRIRDMGTYGIPSFNHGFSVNVFDIKPAAMDYLIKKGAIGAASPADLASKRQCSPHFAPGFSNN